MAEKYWFLYKQSDGTITECQRVDCPDEWTTLSSGIGAVSYELTDTLGISCYNAAALGYAVQNGAIVYVRTDQEQLDDAKTAKKIEIKTAYTNADEQPFSSAALGTIYTYLNNSTAKTRYDAIYARFHNDSTYTSEDIYTLEAGNLAHNKEQFTQVWTDGFTKSKTVINQYDDRIAQINSIQLANYPTLQDAINAVQGVVWS